MTTRSETRPVFVGNVQIGGGAPVSIQSMTKTDTRDVPGTIRQISELAEAGCEIIRAAVPDMEAAEAFGKIKKQIKIPIVADVHFDYRLALESIRRGADKIRINPGNIGGGDRLRQVAESAKAAGIPIRVGVNSGSLEKEILRREGGITANGLCESALASVGMLESRGFRDIVVTVKSTDVPTTFDAFKLLAEKIGYPLHIGITEAGTPYRGSVRSAVGLGALLCMGIGDTIRVSLTGNPVEEVKCARLILQSAGVRKFGAEMVSCPTCGRTGTDMMQIAEKIEAFCENFDKPIKVAVMGCEVNGPGEAREADYGAACGKGSGALFKKGEVIKKVPDENIADELIELIKRSENIH
ncbi:MAG: flavodoxin-dependent (E)-4-hydroxy-3-methylbut-2-enyl-diphosphate synthase [Defluviitaleaceae bacterium]|nr:flavodoxin-dependent (E)-4-hydroxy-3-methylbut-2-enyl-diphosphate synthase [Defluviitaleaceae bacterium]